MVSIKNNIGQNLFSIDWEDGIINITKAGVENFIKRPQELLRYQPRGIKFKKETKKMYQYLKYNKLL